MLEKVGQSAPLISVNLSANHRLANHRLELKLRKSISQSVVRFQMMSHYKSKPRETLPAPQIFGTLFHFNTSTSGLRNNLK